MQRWSQTRAGLCTPILAVGVPEPCLIPMREKPLPSVAHVRRLYVLWVDYRNGPDMVPVT